MPTTHNLRITVPNFPVHVARQQEERVTVKNNLKISTPKFPIAATRLLTSDEIYTALGEKFKMHKVAAMFEIAELHGIRPRRSMEREYKRLVGTRKPIV